MRKFKISLEKPDSRAVRVEAVIKQLERNKQYYTEIDPKNKTLGIFADATLKALEVPVFRSQIDDMLALRPTLEAPHAVKLLERSYQADLLAHDPQYPKGYQDVSAWLDSFAEVQNDDARSEMLLFRLLTQNVQSNIAERYKSVKLIAALQRDQFGDAPSHLDVGSSIMHGDIKLVYNDSTVPRVPFGPIRLEKSMTSDEISAYESGNIRPRAHYLATKLANIALNQQVQFGEVRGVDITEVGDPSIRTWIKSCSFYPDELFDTSKVTEYDALDELDPTHERVQFTRCDFSNIDDVRRLREVAPAEGYNYITFSTVFYQVSPAERTAMLVNAAQLLSEGGKIIIQDARDGNFSKHYNYTTSIVDSAHPRLGEQQILRWKTARCEEAMIGLGRLSVRGKLLHFDQALEEII